jgi:hypothetical protein
MVAKQDRVVGPDGRERTSKQEHEINEAFVACFNSRAGELVFNYLRSITINAVTGPEVTDEHLRHLEGQRFLFGMINQRFESGAKQRQFDMAKEQKEKK